jgi:hypothetical protein
VQLRPALQELPNAEQAVTPCLRPSPSLQVFILAAAALLLAACGSAHQAPAAAARTHTAAEVDGLPPGVTQEEIAWALALEKQVQQGYQPTPQELERYTAIYERLAASQRESPDSNPNRPARPSQADIDWAVALMQEITQGYKPTPQEVARYTDIFERLQASQAQ